MHLNRLLVSPISMYTNSESSSATSRNHLPHHLLVHLKYAIWQQARRTCFTTSSLTIFVHVRGTSPFRICSTCILQSPFTTGNLLVRRPLRKGSRKHTISILTQGLALPFSHPTLSQTHAAQHSSSNCAFVIIYLEKK